MTKRKWGDMGKVGGGMEKGENYVNDVLIYDILKNKINVKSRKWKDITPVGFIQKCR